MEQKATLMKLNDKKLGRGLSALLGENKVKSSLLSNTNDDSIIKIALDKIEAGIYQPRNKFDENELAELAESIKEHGVIQPIIVRKKKMKNMKLLLVKEDFAHLN